MRGQFQKHILLRLSFSNENLITYLSDVKKSYGALEEEEERGIFSHKKVFIINYLGKSERPK